ncbi:MAG TPA: retroviral-like aspartic protease family protein [Sphingomonas sp.]|nr:retroviral-like aspartic protease family protein [Sphingomonas sp.]
MAHAGYRHSLVAYCLLGALVIAGTQTATAKPGNRSSSPLPAAESLEILPSGHPVVQVSIDGSAPKRFVIDTAASSTTIMPKLRAAMPGLVVKDSGAPLDGASGRTHVETTVVGQLQIAGHVFRSPELLLLPPGPTDRLGIDGILGADIIADFAVEMDLPGRNWRMTPKVEAGMLDGLSASAPFTLDAQRAPRLTIRINGIEMPAVLDTGARGTIVNWAGAKAIGLTPDSPGLAKVSDIKGATNHATASVETRLTTLSIGEAEVEAPKIRIADLSVFKVLGFGAEQPAVILGIDMFADRRLVIDHPGLRLHVSPPTAPRAATPQS